MSNPLPETLIFSVSDAAGTVRYLNFSGSLTKQIRCLEDGVFNVTAKFAIEWVGNGNNVHIRSCFDNHYWSRGPTAPQWLHALAPVPVEATLFRAHMGPGGLSVSFVHVQSGLNVVMRPVSDTFAYYVGVASSAATEFRIINYTSLVKIPKYVTFRADINKYLAEGEYYNQIGKILRYDADAPTVPEAGFETFVTRNGDIRVKSRISGNFWRRRNSEFRPTFVVPTYPPDSDPSNPNTLFEVFESVPPPGYNIRGIALRSRGNGLFCWRMVGDEYLIRDGFAAHELWKKSSDMETRGPYDGPNEGLACMDVRSLGDPSKCRVTVAEFRHHRIYNTTSQKSIITSRVFQNKTDRDVQQNIRNEQQQQQRSMRYKFTNSITHGQGMTNFSSRMPYLDDDGRLVIPNDVVPLGVKAWGQTYDYNYNSAAKSAIQSTVTVPAKSRVTATLLAGTATCEIPFSYDVIEEFVGGGGESYGDLYDGLFTGEYTYAYEVRIDKTEPL